MGLKEHLRGRRIRQTDLAARLGVSQSTVSQWVAGGRPIPTQYLRAFAECAGLPVESLVPPKAGDTTTAQAA